MSLVHARTMNPEDDDWEVVVPGSFHASRTFELVIWADANSSGGVKIKSSSAALDHYSAILPRNGHPITLRFVWDGTNSPVVQAVGPERGTAYMILNEV